MTVEAFAEAFVTFRRYAWRLEARDTYDVPGAAEDMATWRATGTVAPDPGWTETIRLARERGVLDIGRIRLVGMPITDYTRMEFVAYRNRIAAGEDVQAIDRRQLNSTWNEAPDFWIFDGQAWLMHYTDTGDFHGATPVTDSAPYRLVMLRLLQYAAYANEYELDRPAPAGGAAIPFSLPEQLAATRRAG